MLYSTVSRSGASSSARSRTSAKVMCRASGRGWTVIPRAPASTHTRAASTTLGMPRAPPSWTVREFRRVAILLTLTERRVTWAARSLTARRPPCQSSSVMGKGDNRRTLKVRQRRRQKKFKARKRRRMDPKRIPTAKSG